MEDIVLIHDGVRPLVDLSTIHENIRIAKQYGCAITVHPVTESVVITESEEAGMSDFKKRANTYTMTAPQTFQLGKIIDAYQKIDNLEQQDMPLLDAAMVYAQTGGDGLVRRPAAAKSQVLRREVGHRRRQSHGGERQKHRVHRHDELIQPHHLRPRQPGQNDPVTEAQYLGDGAQGCEEHGPRSGGQHFFRQDNPPS